MLDVMLEAKQITKEFSGFVAVSDVNLQANAAIIHVLIGPNGAGKIACLNLLTKFITPTVGQVIYKGQGVTHKSSAEIARIGKGRFKFLPSFLV